MSGEGRAAQGSATLRSPACRRTLQRPAYDRSAVTPGIVHLGIGAFHRAHQAVYIDDVLKSEPRLGDRRREPSQRRRRATR